MAFYTQRTHIINICASKNVSAQLRLANNIYVQWEAHHLAKDRSIAFDWTIENSTYTRITQQAKPNIIQLSVGVDAADDCYPIATNIQPETRGHYRAMFVCSVFSVAPKNIILMRKLAYKEQTVHIANSVCCWGNGGIMAGLGNTSNR